ncbi:RedV protein [Streptomyces diacarni]|uniref:RedV protein n=1 Tax=Streptomyces diacarni TaxID=2800381 RepID=A0A367EVW4_9ACTN|nr:RedV protein [Streptomyces diacarni]RCG21300.1 RedV protein [Streptomyces diacarni]
MQPTDMKEHAPEEEFGAALTAATALAAHAPSSHNCQPWGIVRLAGTRARAAAGHVLGVEPRPDEEYVALALDHERELSALPAHATEMRVSCGAYWRILLRGLAAQGWHATRTRTPASEAAPVHGWPHRWSLLCIGALRRTATCQGSLAELHGAVHNRRTCRGPYRSEPLDPAVLTILERPSEAPGAAPAGTVTTQHITQPHLVRAFADFCAQHAGRDFSHHKAWRETHSFLRWSAAHARSRGDGFTLPQLFGPLSPLRQLSTRVLLNPKVLLPLCGLGYHRRLAAGVATLIRESTPGLLAMGFEARRPGLADMLAGGARLADYWLAATEAGVALHPLSVAVQHEDLRQELQKSLGLRGRTFFISRLGSPEVQGSPTLRRQGSAVHHPL